MTIYEMYHPELVEKTELTHQATTEVKIRNIKQRISLLEGRQPLKENQAIIKKLKRELNRLEADK